MGMEAEVKAAVKTLEEGTGEGNDFLGWLHLPTDYDKEEFDRIKKAAEKIKADSDVLVVVGIGGSYLRSKSSYRVSYLILSQINYQKKKEKLLKFILQETAYLEHILLI